MQPAIAETLPSIANLQPEPNIPTALESTPIPSESKQATQSNNTSYSTSVPKALKQIGSRPPPNPRPAADLVTQALKQTGSQALKQTGSRPPPDPRRFADLVAQGVSKRQAALQAGYAPGYKPLNNGPARRALATVAQQRIALQCAPGFRLRDSAQWYKEASKSPEPLAPRVAARRALDSLLGYDAPRQVQVESRSLIVELSGLGTADLSALREYISAPPPQLSDQVDTGEVSDINTNQGVA